MTTTVDIINRALQQIGTRTSVTSAELSASSTNEAIQANIILDTIRQDILRMAPWNSAIRTANLTYITSSPGTPENSSAQTTLWQPGQPAPPWSYEYQYPVDCVRALFVIPATQTGFAGGIPITTAVTGGAAAFWQGPPVKFQVRNDQFLPVTAASVAAGGSGYAVGDQITLASGPITSPPIGAPVVLQVATVGAGGAVATVAVVSQVFGEASPLGGSYFALQPGATAQGSTTGLGSGATFTLVQGGPIASQRVILTNQEFATLTYIQQITDPNLMDAMLQSAWSDTLAANLAIALTGDKSLANMLIGKANVTIERARTPDGNEGFTINDVTPDWIRTRGVAFTDTYSDPYGGPYSQFDWGGALNFFG
jgi:hypothetical protein